MGIKINVKSRALIKYLKSVEAGARRELPIFVNRAAQAIKRDIAAGIKQGIDIQGRPFKPLKPGTIKSKRAKGYKYPRRALYGKGIMQNVYLSERATVGRPRARLIAPRSRENIGRFHNEGTAAYTIRPRNKKALGPLYDARGGKYFAKRVRHPGLPRREWWGVSSRAKQTIAKLLKQFVNRIIDNG